VDRTEDRERAVALVKRAIAHMRAVGRERALADINDPHGPFVEGERYVIVWDRKGVQLASAGAPHFNGRDMSGHTDVDGKLITRDVLDLAASMGSGWYDYRMMNPVSGRVEPKSLYVERYRNLVFGCGIYRPEAEREADRRSAGAAPVESGAKPPAAPVESRHPLSAVG
ncbi:MAG TPA: cache domain-containing protein, partial [Burkholderiales bacterium]